MATSFWVELRGEKYDSVLGWYCPALTLPGAVAEKILVGGEERPITHFQIDAAQIRFTGPAPAPVPNGAIKIVLSKRLVPIDTTILVAIVGLIGTLVSAWVSYRLGIVKPPLVTVGSNAVPNDAATTSILVPPPSSASANASSPKNKPGADKIRLSFPRGYHGIINAYGTHEVEELRKLGIRTDDVKEGLRVIYTAMMKKSPTDCAPIEWPLDQDGKVKDPSKYEYIEYRFDCEGSGDPRYSTFDMFQGDENLTIYFEESGKKFGPVKPAGIGINWEAVRIGIRKALLALHKDSISIEFSDIQLYQEDNGKWGYHLPLRVRPLKDN